MTSDRTWIITESADKMFDMKDKPLAAVVLVFMLSLFYAMVRYNIFKGVDWVDFPIYVLNKALSLSILILFALVHYHRNRAQSESSALIQESAVLFAALHILLSLLIFSPHYFPDFFADGKLSLTANLSMLFGVLAIGILLVLTNKKSFKALSFTISKKNNMARILFLAISMHVLIMGFNGWIKPNTWPGNLPPITLVAFIVAAMTVILIKKRKA